MRYFLRAWSKNANCGENLRRTKDFNENTIEKLNFYFIFILENFYRKTKPRKVSLFLQHFFGWGDFPLATPLQRTLQIFACRNFNSRIQNAPF